MNAVLLSLLIHMAPTGWQYGAECCSAIDCRQALPNQVIEGKDGYLVKEDNEVKETLVPYHDAKIKKSKDEFFHVCSAILGDKHLICLYVPPRGY